MIIRIKKKLFYMARPENCPVQCYQLAIVCLSGGGEVCVVVSVGS